MANEKTPNLKLEMWQNNEWHGKKNQNSELRR